MKSHYMLAILAGIIFSIWYVFGRDTSWKPYNGSPAPFVDGNLNDGVLR